MVSPTTVFPPKGKRVELPVDWATYGRMFVQACQVWTIGKIEKATKLGMTPTFGSTITFLSNQGIRFKRRK